MGFKINFEAWTWSMEDEPDGDPEEGRREAAKYIKMIFGIFLAVIVVELLMVYLLMRLLRPKASEGAGASKRTLIVLGSGGHTAEMLKLVESLDHARYSPRMYVVANTDAMSGRKAEAYEQALLAQAGTSTGSTGPGAAAAAAAARPADAGAGPPDAPSAPAKPWEVHVIPRSREVGQSYITSVATTLNAIAVAVVLVFRTRPQVLLVNGPGTCIPVCFAVVLHRLLVSPCKIIYVESIARTRKLSLSGRILYQLRLADLLLVQWQELADKLPRAKFAGRLY